MKFDFTRYWYRDTYHWTTFLLLPFSWLMQISVSLRKFLYSKKILTTHYFSAPVIVVGNITVGGTGKTPFVIWLAAFLREQGYRPGIVSRGIGGQKHTQPHWVNSTDLPSLVGDEALLLLKETHCPLVIGINRPLAVKKLLANSNCNIIISDDGLQHYRMGRAIEIAMVDGIRRFGNQCLLPAGPLRESIHRLKQVDLVVMNGEDMFLEPIALVSLKHPEQSMPLLSFPEKKVHAIAGIGHPERFFLELKKQGFDVIPHYFKDHHLYNESDLDFPDDYPILMTEKDAVKCQFFAKEKYWFVKSKINVNSRLKEMTVNLLNLKGSK